MELKIIFLLVLQSSHGMMGLNQMIQPHVFVEGCIDLTCLKLLSHSSKQFSMCVQPLTKTVDHSQPEGQLELCCSVKQYQQCIFPMIISHCGMDSIDIFDQEMKSINSICSIVTLAWSKCEPKPIKVDQESNEATGNASI